MFMVILLAALSILAIASTIVALYRDGYRRVPTEWSRLPDNPTRDNSIRAAEPAGPTMWQVDAGWGNRPANNGALDLRVQATSTR